MIRAVAPLGAAGNALSPEPADLQCTLFGHVLHVGVRLDQSLRPTTLRAVHFVIDSDKAEKLRAAWLPDRDVSLEFVDCPDRRLTRAAAELGRLRGEKPPHSGHRDLATAQLLAAAGPAHA